MALGISSKFALLFSALLILQTPLFYDAEIAASSNTGTRNSSSFAAYAVDSGITLADASVATSSAENVDAQQYSQLTKKILVAGIELERFSLHFRQQSARQPKYRKIRFGLAQETGAACGLAFEIAADEQFKKGRRRPLQVSKPALHGALTTVMTGSIIAGSSSCLELTSNAVQAIKNRRNGFDFKTANKFVAAKLKEIDSLLAERKALVGAHPDYPGYEAAVIEGEILHELRNCFVTEYSHFNADTKGYVTYQNVFYLLNASYNAVGAAGAWVAYRGVTKPSYNGPANILFTISGAMTMVTPLLSQAAGNYARKQAYKAVEKEIGEKPQFDQAAFDAQCKRLQVVLPSVNGRVIPSLPGTERMALYTQSSELFKKQLDSETHTMRRLEKVAVQNSLLGPVIGAQLMTQGILGTVGSYRYNLRPRKQLSMFYRGSIVGTVGTSMATVGNAVSLLATLSYQHRLAKEKKLPEQLIEQRLEHLAEIEKSVRAM